MFLEESKEPAVVVRRYVEEREKVAVAATRSFEPQFDQALEIVAVHSVRGQFRRHDRPEGLTVHQNANGEVGDSRRSTRSAAGC